MRRPIALWVLVSGLLFPACGDGRAGDVQLALLVTVDTLRVDRIGAYGGELDLTPNLDALARESEVFANAFAPAPFTLPSLVALHTGLYPEQAGVHSNNTPLPSDVATLAELLRDEGWSTAAVVSNYVLRERSGLAAGFDLYDARFPQLEAARDLPERIADATADHAIEALDALLADGADRIFLWVHFQDPHGPYTPPNDLRQRYLTHEMAQPDGSRQLEIQSDGMGGLPEYQVVDEEGNRSEQAKAVRRVAAYRAGYDGEVRYMDTHVGRLFDALERRGLGDATIVFAADHGESLGEKDYWFSHGEYLDESVMRVPLMIRAPGRRPRRRSDLAGLVDIFPTLVSRLGVVAPPAEGHPGRDLFAESRRGDTRALLLSNLGVAQQGRHGIVTRDYRLVAEASAPKQPARVRTYRLGVDEPLAASEAQVPVAELAARLRELRTAFPSRKPLPAALSAEETQRLRSLGYVEP